jgi:hypothetical protein
MFGFNTTLLCTWEVIVVYVNKLPALYLFFRHSNDDVLIALFYSCSSLGLSLPNGGTAGLFWSYIVTIIGLTLVYSSLAELGSM